MLVQLTSVIWHINSLPHVLFHTIHHHQQLYFICSLLELQVDIYMCMDGLVLQPYLLIYNNHFGRNRIYIYNMGVQSLRPYHASLSHIWPKVGLAAIMLFKEYNSILKQVASTYICRVCIHYSFQQRVEKIISTQQSAFKQYIRLLLKRNLTDPSSTTLNTRNQSQQQKINTLFAWSYQPCLSVMIQCFSLTTKQHQPAEQV